MKIDFTPDQAEAFARWYLAPAGEEDPTDAEILHAAGCRGHFAVTGPKHLCRWALRWVPIIMALEALKQPPMRDADARTRAVCDLLSLVETARTTPTESEAGA